MRVYRSAAAAPQISVIRVWNRAIEERREKVVQRRHMCVNVTCESCCASTVFSVRAREAFLFCRLVCTIWMRGGSLPSVSQQPWMYLVML